MKNSVVFLASIIALLLFVFLACSKTELREQTETETLYDETETVTLGNIAVSDRSDCDNCPSTECCCGIELLEPTIGSFSIELCGTSDGISFCGTFMPGGQCPDITNGGQSHSLNFTTNPRVPFCMDENTALNISNPTVTSITVRITCQADLTSPQFDTLTIPAGTRVSRFVDGSCLFEPC